MHLSKSVLSITVLGAITLAPTASAENFYAEGTFGLLYNDQSSLYEDDHTLVGARFGYDLTSHLAIEGEFAFGIDDVSETRTVWVPNTLTQASMTEEINHSYGVFGKFTYPMTTRFSAHGRIGLSGYEQETFVRYDFLESDNVEEHSYTDTRGNLAYGLGASYAFSDKIYARLDATRYGVVEEDTDSLTFGLGVRF